MPGEPQTEQEPVAWQWRYAGDTVWYTSSGGKKLSPEVLEREPSIEQRPLYAAPVSQSSEAPMIGEYRADYSQLTPEEIAHDEPELVGLYANSSLVAQSSEGRK